MMLIPVGSSREEIFQIVLTANNSIEQAEIILSNLLALRCKSNDRFKIPHDDVVVTIEAAIKILEGI